jgi:hypothetical protein
MAKAKKFELESPAPILDDEDEETFAAIDEVLRESWSNRTRPSGLPPPCARKVR